MQPVQIRDTVEMLNRNGREWAEWARLLFWLSELHSSNLTQWANTSENVVRLEPEAANDIQFGLTLSAETFIGFPTEISFLADLRWSGACVRGHTLFLGGRIDWDEGMADEALVAVGIPMAPEFAADLVADGRDYLRLCKCDYDVARGWTRSPGALIPLTTLPVTGTEAFMKWLRSAK